MFKTYCISYTLRLLREQGLKAEELLAFPSQLQDLINLLAIDASFVWYDLFSRSSRSTQDVAVELGPRISIAA